MTLATASHPGWLLRFHSGALRGRTVALNRGANVLGSAGECDVMLPGRDMLPRHLVINVGEIAVSVQRVGSAAARLNGEEMAQSRRSLMVGDVVSVGGVEFQLDRSYAAPEAQDSMFLPDGEAAPAEPAAQAPAARRRSRALRWATFGGVWLVSLFVLSWTLSSGRAEPGARGDTVDMAQLQARLADFPEAEAVASPSGHIAINGFVESGSRKQALVQAMQPFGALVSVNVQPVDQLIEQARRFVADPGIAAAYTGKGQLQLSGRTDSATAQERVRRLAEDLHPMVRVNDKVEYRPRPAADPRQQWAEWQNLLPGRVVSITEDAQGLRHIQLANGNRYYEGAVLPSGSELRSLRADDLVLTPGAPREP